MRKRICALMVAVLVLCCLPLEAFAVTEIDLDKESSISVTVVYDKTPLKGMTLYCIRVGDLVPDPLNPHFKSLYDDTLFTSENIANSDAPGKMLELVKKGTKVAYSAVADQDGKIKFTKLKPGLYLVYQSNSFTYSGKKFDISPFFVTIPYGDDYDVDACSKPALAPDFTEKGSGTPSSGTPGPGKGTVTKLPQTGQLTWPVPVMAIGGMSFFALGWWLCFGRRKDSHEK